MTRLSIGKCETHRTRRLKLITRKIRRIKEKPPDDLGVKPRRADSKQRKHRC